MKYFIAVIFLILPGLVFGQSVNLALPQSPSSYQSDRFRQGDLDCSNAIGGGTNLEFGVVGLLDQQPYETIGPQNHSFLGDYQRDVGVYARITIPLDKPKERINSVSYTHLTLPTICSV